MASAAAQELVVTAAGGPTTLQYDNAVFSVKHADGAKGLQLDVRQVLWIEVMHDIVEVSFLARRKKKEPLRLEKLNGRVDDTKLAQAWAESVLSAAYQGVKQCRKLKVLVNPHGGVKKALSIFTKIVEPILRSARCSIDITHTTHRGHGYEIAKDLSLDYDAVVTLSGDGLIHEVINGLAEHERSSEALAISIAPIPAGSGNAMSLNLLGLENGFDAAVAALNVIKGQPMKADLFSITQGEKKSYSFMSQATGLMADVDIGTENLRWMGDTRFWVGLFRGLAQFRPCPVELSIKVAVKDKATQLQMVQTRRKVNGDAVVATIAQGTEAPLKSSDADGPGWYTFTKPLAYVYGGQGPYVARDFMAFPVSLPDDGFIDLVAQELTNRGDLMSGIAGAEKGETFWRDSYHYIKAHAYRVRPISDKGTLSVDGEIFPFKEFQVEVHPRMVSFLSPFGTYAVDFPSAEQGRRKRKI